MARYSLSDRTGHISKSEFRRLLSFGEYRQDPIRRHHLIRLTQAERLEARRVQREIEEKISAQPRAAGTLPPVDVPGVRFHEPTSWQWRIQHRSVRFPQAEIA